MPVSPSSDLYVSKIDGDYAANKVTTINDAIDAFSRGLGGKADISLLTGGSRTLTTTEAQNAFLNCSGTLGADQTILIPVTGTTGRCRTFVVYNGTTGGSFKLSISITGSSAPVEVPRSGFRLVYHDGTNAYAIGGSGFLSGVAARVFNSANQSIPNGTWTSITFDSEHKDDFNLHSTSSNTSRYTFTSATAGVYAANCSIAFDANSTGTRAIRFLLNGTTVLGYAQLPPVTAALTLTILPASMPPYSFAAGDYLEVQVYQDTGGSLNSAALNSGSGAPVFGLWRVQ